MTKKQSILALCASVTAAVFVPGAATAGDEPAAKCPKSKARPANPHGSVLMPVREAPPTTLLSDEIIPMREQTREERREAKLQRRRNRENK